MHNQSWTHGTASHLQPAWTHRSRHQRVTAAARLSAQTGKYHNKYSATSKVAPTTPNGAITWSRLRQQHREDVHNLSTFRGKTSTTVVRWVPLSYEHVTYPLMHREMCKAWRVCVLHLSFWTCVRTYWGMHVHTQRVCGGGMVMQWQEYHTYFPVRESLSLLWDRKTTSMTKTHVHTHKTREGPEFRAALEWGRGTSGSRS